MNVSKEIPASRVNIYETEYYLVSFFGRLNYTFNNKYLLTATLRNDNTSRFDESLRSGLFPSVALAWKIKEENFIKDVNAISDLKLRVGYGATGQQDVGQDYAHIATYTISDKASRYQLGNTFYNTLRPDGYNQFLKWESTATYNAGLDYGLLGNRITGTLDFYHRKSTNLLSYLPPAAGSNFTGSLASNVGDLTNKGIELTINSDIISTDDFQWNLGYNVTYNKNIITKLTLNDDPNFKVLTGGVGGTTAGTIQAQVVGYPAYSYLVYQQVYDHGKPVEDTFVDRNGDGVVNSSDLYLYKKPGATVFMGINSRMNYKNWDFSFTGRVSLGNYNYNNVASGSTYNSLYSSLGYIRNISTQANDTKFTTALNTRFSDYYIQNASFFRMDNINIGHTFNKLYKDKMNLRIGAGVQNAFVITKYKGVDPEISGGLDNNFFPRTRSFFLNLNFQF